MKTLFCGVCAIFSLIGLFCGPLPTNPHDNPDLAGATVLSVNDDVDFIQPVSVASNSSVAVQIGLKNSWFIDSIKFWIQMNNEEVGMKTVHKSPWEHDTIDTAIVFPSQGTGTLVYTIYRNNNTRKTEKMFFNVTSSGTNRPPVWNPKSIPMFSEANRVAVRGLLPYITDPDGDDLQFKLAPSGSSGFSLHGDSLTSTASLDDNVYVITVIASDGTLSDSATVRWRVYTPPSGDADIKNDKASTTAATPVTIDVLANDDLQPSSVLSFVSQGRHGKAVISDSKIVYTPVKDFTGADTLFYLVNGKDTGYVFVTVSQGTSNNHPPVWFPDTAELYSVAGHATNGNAAIFASDPDKDDLTYTIDLPTGTGFTANKAIISSSVGSAEGTYHINVTVSDGTDEVDGVIKWTVCKESSGQVTTVSDPVDVAVGTTVTINVLDNDEVVSGDGTMLITQVSQGKHGKSFIQDGTIIIYTPDQDFTGNDTIFYIVNGSDTGWVYLSVTGTPNKSPVWSDASINQGSTKGTAAKLDLKQYATDPDHDELVFTITPPKDAAFTLEDHSWLATDGSLAEGTYEIKVSASDGKRTAEAKVTWTVIADQDVKVEINADAGTVDAGGSVTVKVLENDRIVSGEGTLTITSVGKAGHGATAYNGNEVRYTPETGYSGTDRFCYVVNGSDTGWVDITVKSAGGNFTVTFDKNDENATGSMDPQTIAANAKVALVKNTYTKAGWQFTGWATTSDGDVTYTDGAEFTMGTKNVTLFAIWKANPSYTVTFDKNDEDAIGTMEPQSIVSGATAPLTANAFVKEGWSFMGWATSEEGEVAYADESDYPMKTENVTLFAVWSASDFVVTFYKNDTKATGKMLPQTIAAGSSAPLTANAFVKDGWKFEGWAETETGKVVYIDGANYSMGSKSASLYAVWSAKSFSITFDKNDNAATGTMTPQAIASGSDAALAKNAFNKAGATFEGWAITSNGGVVYPDGGNYTMGTSDDTLYAKWKAKTLMVSFDKNDDAATGTMADQGIAAGTSAALQANAFVKPGWAFQGWAETKTGTVAYADGAKYTMGTANVKLFAIWSATSKTVTFKANDPAATGTMTPQNIASGSSAPLKTNSFQKTGSSFAGWAETETGEVAYADGAPYTMGAEDVVLYAVWTVKKSKLTFNKNGGNGTPPPEAWYEYNSSVTIPGAGTLSNTGYDFNGWNTKDDGNGTTYAEGASLKMGDTDIELFALWKIKTYTITVSADKNGKVSSTLLTVEHGKDCAPITATPNSGFEFHGWTGDVTGTENPLTIKKITSDMAITATFSEKLYTVKFVAGAGGKITGELEQHVPSGGNCTPVTAVPDANNQFVSWSGSGGHTSVDNPFTASGITADITITATFSEKLYTVKFVAGAGGKITGDLEQHVPSGGNCTEVTAVPDPDYRFVSWKGSAGREVTINPFTASGITADITITANFAIQYKVTFTAVNGTITPAAEQWVNAEASTTPVTAKAALNFSFTGFKLVSDSKTTYDYSNPLTIANVGEDYQVSADFTRGSKSLPLSDMTGIRKFGSTGDPILLTFSAVKQTEDRTVAHFNISALSDTVKNAMLVIPLSNIDAGGEDGTFVVYSFAGDGTVSADEFDAGSGTPVVSVSNLKYSKENIKQDVTALLNSFIVADESYLSFSFRCGTRNDRYDLGDFGNVPNAMVLYTP